MASGRLVAMDIMHRVPVELCAMLSRMLAAGRQGAVIALSIVEVMIYVPVKVFRPVKPGSRADKNAARKPLWPVVAVWRAIIRGNLVIAIGTNRRLSDTDCNLCIRFSRGSE
jgi:hypothetical protein